MAAGSPPLLRRCCPARLPRADPSLPLLAVPVLHRDPPPTRTLRAAAAPHSAPRLRPSPTPDPPPSRRPCPIPRAGRRERCGRVLYLAAVIQAAAISAFLELTRPRPLLMAPVLHRRCCQSVISAFLELTRFDLIWVFVQRGHLE
ncbi:hypothetical protein BS78_01G120200 [Paspalum vaginatum]|nr:hypothetical protein BS78_01G120200 [Paspalum vaginatum]